MRLRLVPFVLVLVLAACKKEEPSHETPASPSTPATTTPAATTAAAPTTTTPPAPALDDAKKKQLAAVFEGAKAGLKKCDPLAAEAAKAIAARDFSTAAMKTRANSLCRREWLRPLMPKITAIAPLTEDQAFDELAAWDNGRKK